MRRDDIIKYLRAQSMKWWGHLNRTEKTKISRKIMEWHAIGVRSKGRPKNRGKDELLNDLRKLKAKNWIYLIKDRKARYELVHKTKTHKGLWCQQKKNNAVDVVSRLHNGLSKNRISILGRSKKAFCLRNVQTGPGAHSAC
jgi:hypothetical protein